MPPRALPCRLVNRSTIFKTASVLRSTNPRSTSCHRTGGVDGLCCRGGSLCNRPGLILGSEQLRTQTDGLGNHDPWTKGERAGSSPLPIERNP
jgi:hypothetical protein